MSRFCILVVVLGAVVFAAKPHISDRLEESGITITSVVSDSLAGLGTLLDEYGLQPTPDVTKDGIYDIRILSFRASWCGACEVQEAELAKFNVVRVNTIDVNRSPKLAQEYDVTDLPKLVLLRGGKVIDSRVGFQSEATLAEWVHAKYSAAPATEHLKTKDSKQEPVADPSNLGEAVLQFPGVPMVANPYAK